MRHSLRPILIGLGTVGTLSGLILALSEAGAGAGLLIVGALCLLTGLLADRIEDIRRDSLRAVLALGFLVLGSLLLLSGLQVAGTGEPGSATFRILTGLAGISIPVGWVASIFARERLNRGVGGKISEWIVRLWNG